MCSATRMPSWKPTWASWSVRQEVADRADASSAGAAELVDDHESAIERDALLLVAEVRRTSGRGRPRRAAARPRASRHPRACTRTPEAVCSTRSNRAFSLKLILRRRKARSSSLELASSSSGTRCGSASMIVTSVPNERPDAARTRSRSRRRRARSTEPGTRSSCSACSLAITRSPSMVRPGRVREYEPVARITSVPV